MKNVKANANALNNEITWFKQVLALRIKLYFEQETDHQSIYDIKPPKLIASSAYAKLVAEFAMEFDERIIFILSLIPHVQPQALDVLFIRNRDLDRGYTEFGGWKGNTHNGFLPTVETAVFILAGNHLAKRFQVAQLFEPEHPFISKGALRVIRQNQDEPFFSGMLVVDGNYLSRAITGIAHKPDYSASFPAKRITTQLGWDDLVLSSVVMAEVDNIKVWMHSSHIIMDEWGLGKTIKPGYRSLFYGPPGTGKTLTAALIGEDVGVDVYRIDLSMVVSKYIGETEKNLANVFDQAQSKNWILFFDEADALFGKRTQTSSSNDRYANQEVSYLLQRVEDYPGVVILATNLKANIDDAFARRFQSLVYFPPPDAEQRYLLWRNSLNGTAYTDKSVDLHKLAAQYELTGGAITNVVRFAAMNALKRKHKKIMQQDLVDGVVKELRKEGKTA